MREETGHARVSPGRDDTATQRAYRVRVDCDFVGGLERRQRVHVRLRRLGRIALRRANCARSSHAITLKVLSRNENSEHLRRGRTLRDPADAARANLGLLPLATRSSSRCGDRRQGKNRGKQ